MKELWTANPFHLMNRPFAEMDYNSSGLNIVPERLLLATRRPPTHYPLASGAAFFDPLRATCRCATNHLQHTANIWRPPASHLPSFCAAPGTPLHSIRHLTARHPLAPAQHPSAPCKPSARQLTARYPPAHRTPSVIARRSIRHLAASHPPSRCAPSFDPRASSAGTLQAICWHEPMPLTARRTNRRREQEPLIPALRNR